MNKSKIFLICLVFIATFLLVYFPHLNYPMPLHIDEWHHITEGLRMGNYGEYLNYAKIENSNRFSGVEMGFHFILFTLSNFVNLVSFYKFLPALWAGISGLIIFWVVYKKTEKNYWIALLSAIFFASIKSNVNLTGLWFFTPLSFSLPFIFLYIYFFTEGIEKQDIKKILGSLAIMIFLIPIHSISVLFSIPILLIYGLINYKFILKKLPVFLSFLLIPILGLSFYKHLVNIPWSETIGHISNQLQFKYGWGVLEINNSLTEIYSIVGFILAVIGVFYITSQKQLRKYAFYWLWPIITFISIMFYRFTGISYLSPYQRNLYYFALSLPLLSAFGLYFINHHAYNYLGYFLDNKKDKKTNKTITVNFNLESWQIKLIQSTIPLVISIIVIFFAFKSYYVAPKDLELYHVIDPNDYQALTFLKTLPPGNVMATPFISSAIYPISKHDPIANLVFYGNVKNIENFFLFTNCEGKNIIIKQLDVKYIISPAPLECNYKVLYAQNGNIIYQTDNGN